MSRYVDPTTQHSVSYVSSVEAKGLDMFVLNEMNYQYFYRVGDESPEYFTANGDYTFKYQAIGTQIPEEWARKMVHFMRRGDIHQIKEYSMMNDRLIRKDISPSEFILTFNEKHLIDFDVLDQNLVDADYILDTFVQEVCRQDFPTIQGPENNLQFNRYATHRLKGMCVDLQQKYSKGKVLSSIGDINDQEGYIQLVLPVWLKMNSFTIYSVDRTKSIQLMCPLFSYKYTLIGDRSYCVLKFLEWKDGEIAPYMYTVELDPVRALIQRLRLSIDGVIYEMYVELDDDDYNYNDPHPERSDPAYTLPNGVIDTYYRKVDSRYMFDHLTEPSAIRFYDPVQKKQLTYTDFTIDGDCFPIAMTTCLLTVQPDIFRYINLFRYCEYSVHSDGYIAHNSKIERGFYTASQVDMLDLMANRLKYAYPIEPSLGKPDREISGNDIFIRDKPYLSDDKKLDMEDVIYWSPCILLESDYYAGMWSSFVEQTQPIGAFMGNPIYKPLQKFFPFTKGFLSKGNLLNKEYLYSMFDYLGCNTTVPTFFPVLIFGHITILTHRFKESGAREYLILEPQNGEMEDAYEYLIRGNGNYNDNYPSTGAWIRFPLTRTCRKNNHIKSLASPLPMYCSLDPALFKGNYLPIIEQALSTSYLLLRDEHSTPDLSVSSLLTPSDFSVFIQTNTIMVDPSQFSTIDWIRIQLSSLPLIGSVFRHPDIMVNLTESVSNSRLYENFKDFLTYLSDPLPLTIEKLLMPITEVETTNIYVEITKSIFSMDDPSYDASYHMSYLTYLYQKISGVYSALYTGLKVLYVDPEFANSCSVLRIQQFMELLRVIKENLYTIEVYNQQTTKEVVSTYEGMLSPILSKEASLNLFYGKPFLRSLIKYQIMNPDLLPLPFPFDKLISYHIQNKPTILRYRELYRAMKVTDFRMLKVLNYLYFLNDSKQSNLAAFIQHIRDAFNQVLTIIDISPETLPVALDIVFENLATKLPEDFPDPTQDDVNTRLFSYFIFLINLYRFEKTSTFVNRLA